MRLGQVLFDDTLNIGSRDRLILRQLRVVPLRIAQQ
jgi:hypothetical protein